ncbi:cell wall / vacuolar inhibitor of fructosidase 2-like [Primulina tabacum]|uniref:cell wall / vacuolar inhibitor of fructosidase 2-like n=1 Tax=Primulina tabacum TaxID=48773 RepID=UPI003F59C54C
MRSLFPPSFWALMVFHFLLLQHSSGDTQGLIRKICQGTDDFKYCVHVFNKNLYSPTLDIKGLCQIAITQTLSYATDTRIFISKVKQEQKNTTTKNLLVVCEEGYGLLGDEFVNANLAFGRGDYRNMLFYEDKCDRFVSDCQFVIGSRVSNLDVMNAHMRVLVRMSQVSGELITGGR